ncbi:oligosaccharide flippase family protein [Micromonospora matsumotoense]|uniref:lipopolysaccharide biosynthesis protein n=1 Tax=Micromonospora matsumotoense TaxID=121616 RepID=UPI0033F8F884
MAESTGPVGARLTRNTLTMLAARVVVASTGVVTLPIVYARLGAVEFGVWVLLSSLLAMAAVLDLGLGSTLVREVAGAGPERDPVAVRRLLGLGLGWGVVLGLMLLAVLATGWPWISQLLRLGDLSREAWHAALWLLLGVIAGGVETPWRAVLEGVQRYGVLAAVTSITALLGAVLTIVVLCLGGGLAALAACTAGTGILRTALLAVAAERGHRHLAPRLGRLTDQDVRRVTGYGLRVQVTSATSAVNVELDKLILGAAFGPAVAGSADLGVRLLNLLRLPPVFALQVIFPEAIRRTAIGGREWLDRFYLAALRYLAVLLAPAAAALVVGAEPLVRLWLGHTVPWAAATIAILAPAYALNLIAGAATVTARVEGRPGLETRYVLLSVAINLALTVPLLVLVGPLGVPLATSCGVVLATGYFLAHFHRATSRPVGVLLRTLAPPAAAATLAGLVTAASTDLLPDGPGRLGAAAAGSARTTLVFALSTGLLLLCGYLRTDERSRLRALVTKTRLTAVSSVGGDHR